MLKKKTVLRFILGLKIRQLRNRHNLSLKELADKSDLSISYLNEIEKGKKYPKIEKLAALAEALQTDIGELVSFKTGRNLHPLLHFLESDFVSKIPLELFGLNENEVVDLMSYDPEKFASFVLTVLQVSRSFDINLNDVYTAALRSHIENNDNYFPEIESLAKKAKLELNLENEIITYQKLKTLLEEKFKYRIDENKIASIPELTEVKSFVKRKEEKVIFVNNKLSKEQKNYFLAMEIGLHYLKLENDLHKESLTDLMNDFKMRYFSGAFLLDEFKLAGDLKKFFSEKRFDQESFLKMASQYSVSDEVLFHRLTQVLPSHFNAHQLFFLEMSVLDNENLKFVINKELHLSKLHSPHAVHSNEKYCRRWVAIKSLNKLRENPGLNQFLLGQISVVEDGQQYFSMSLAFKSTIQNDSLRSFTIGFLINEELKHFIKFIDDPILKKVEIGQTCERCPKLNCEDRAIPAEIFFKERENFNRNKIIEQLT